MVRTVSVGYWKQKHFKQKLLSRTVSKSKCVRVQKLIILHLIWSFLKYGRDILKIVTHISFESRHLNSIESNEIRPRNHLVRKRTLNHLAKLA